MAQVLRTSQFEVCLTLDLIARAIYDKKGMNILALDVRGISSLCDYVIIAEGNVDKHVIAIAHAIKKALAEHGIYPNHIEGLTIGDWVVLDYPLIMIHLFMPGMRDKYELESLWKASTIVDLNFGLSSV